MSARLEMVDSVPGRRPAALGAKQAFVNRIFAGRTPISPRSNRRKSHRRRPTMASRCKQPTLSRKPNANSRVGCNRTSLCARSRSGYSRVAAPSWQQIVTDAFDRLSTAATAPRVATRARLQSDSCASQTPRTKTRSLRCLCPFNIVEEGINILRAWKSGRATAP